MKLLGCFSVTADDEPDDQRQQVLADRIAAECKERRFKFGEAYVALDCALFMQHRVHSDFSDQRKIAATIRFDTEEALATDVSEMAVAFRIVSSGDAGSTLDVFTAERSVLSDILMSLQSNGIDPVAVDPDVYCLSRFLSEYGASGSDQESGTLCAMLSDSRGYLVSMPASADGASTLRAFLVGPSQDRTSLLAREAVVTTALAASAGPVGKACVVDTSDKLNVQALGEKMSAVVESFIPTTLAGIESEQMADCSGPIDLVAAYGAALGQGPKDVTVSLRNDHMPYLGKKARVQRAVRFLSISVSILLLAVGIYAQAHLLRVNRHRQELKVKLEPDYLAVMLNKRKLPDVMSQAVRDVEGELKRVSRGKSGDFGLASVPARLAQIFQAINACAKGADLQIESISIGKNVTVIGSTSSSSSTGKVYDAFAAVGFKDGQTAERPDEGREAFRVTFKINDSAQ